ncbi:MAG: extracellular solute-binding protein [Thermodesulfobacteriota bacterium]
MKRLIPLLVLALLLAVLPAPAVAAEEVHFYNWTEYLPDAVLRKFTKETGIKVVYSTYESNESMYAKLKMLGGEGYDLVVPSAYFVSRMRREGMLLPLDKSLLPNWRNLDPDLLDKPFDPGNAYSAPYNWGGTGIAVDAAKVKAESVTSFADLWRPEFKNALVLNDDLRDVFGMALRRLGYSQNETDPQRIEEAYKLLKELLPNVRTFNSDAPKMPFLNREVSAGLIFNGEAYQAQPEMRSLAFIWPKEGGLFWMDLLVIPKAAKNPKGAHALINFLLRPDVAKMICEELGYPTPNLAAREMLPVSLRNNKIVYPPADVVARSEFQDDVGQAVTVYDEYWNRLKAGN